MTVAGQVPGEPPVPCAESAAASGVAPPLPEPPLPVAPPLAVVPPAPVPPLPVDPPVAVLAPPVPSAPPLEELPPLPVRPPDPIAPPEPTTPPLDVLPPLLLAPPLPVAPPVPVFPPVPTTPPLPLLPPELLLPPEPLLPPELLAPPVPIWPPDPELPPCPPPPVDPLHPRSTSAATQADAMNPLMAGKCVIDNPLLLVSKGNGQQVARIDHEMRRRPESRGEPANFAGRAPSREGMEILPGQPFQGVHGADSENSRGRIGGTNREERRIRGRKGWVHEASEPIPEYGDVEVDE